ncbi:MAG: hypothetical protein ABI645_15620 [Pseudomonadota bacterium]
MSCEDIDLAVDMRSVSALTAAERSELQAHARTCARCASQWGIEMGLAAVRIPSMSPLLVNRCKPRGHAGIAVPGRRRVLRPAVFSGVALVLVAAAAIPLVRSTSGNDAIQQAAELEVAPVQIAQIQPVELARTPESPAVPESAVQLPPLPLLPLPVADSRRRAESSADMQSRMDWALARAIERYPELVEGPEREGRLFVAFTLYEDGRILNEAMRFASEVDFRSVETELRQTLPPDGQQGHGARQKGSRLPDGRLLRNDLVFRFSLVPDQYDAIRTHARVAEIVRARHADLMVPATRADIGRLIVFMSDDGQIQRESYVNDPLKGNGVLSADDPASVAFLAQQISTSLGVDINQIGLIGLGTLQDGPAAVGNVDGSLNVSDKLRVLPLLYAWPRRAGEIGPSWGQPRVSAKPTFDTTAALAIVERYMPDAFVRTEDRAVGQPTIVLTAEGKFIRSTRVMQEGPIEQRMLQLEQLGRDAAYSTAATLKNRAGQTADVMFVWEKADPGQ